MGRKGLVSVFGFFALAVAMVLPGVAHAELRFCNHTNEQVTVAIGYNNLDDNQWTSEGWWTIDPGQCKVPFGGTLKSRYYYYYAESDSGKWDGDYIFCTQDSKFTIEGSKDCKSRGYSPEGFREIDVGEDTAKEVDLDAN
jgi:uncharacterized membrane protein